MVLFKDPRKTIEVELPSFPWSKVVLFNSLRTGEQNDLIAKYEGWDRKGNAGDILFGQEMIFLAIKERNFEEEEGKPLPLTLENFKLLPRKDVEHIMKALWPVSWIGNDPEKKKTSDSEIDGSEAVIGGEGSTSWLELEAESAEGV